VKQGIAIGLTFILLLSLAGQGHCQTSTRKLSRGISNIATCPLEIFEQTKRAYDSDGAIAALTYGLVKGVLMTGARALTGVYETATFLIPLPHDYKPILDDPEFFSEDLPIW